MAGEFTADNAVEFIGILKRTVNAAQRSDERVMRSLLPLGLVVPPGLLVLGWPFAAPLASVT